MAPTQTVFQNQAVMVVQNTVGQYADFHLFGVDKYMN